VCSVVSPLHLSNFCLSGLLLVVLCYPITSNGNISYHHILHIDRGGREKGGLDGEVTVDSFCCGVFPNLVIVVV